jgi:hypothetical protein
MEDNYKNRLHLQATGVNLLAESEEDKERGRIEALHRDLENEGGHIIHADEKRL